MYVKQRKGIDELYLEEGDFYINHSSQDIDWKLYVKSLASEMVNISMALLNSSIHTEDKLMRIIKWYLEHKTGDVKLVSMAACVGDKFTYQVCKCDKCCETLIPKSKHIKHMNPK